MFWFFTLDGLSQIIASSFPIYNVLVYLSSRYVVIPMQCDVEETFVISKIQINFATIIENKNFPLK